MSTHFRHGLKAAAAALAMLTRLGAGMGRRRHARRDLDGLGRGDCLAADEGL